MTATPATRSARVCPTPQSPPTREELQRLLRSLTMADTAARWSASTACLRPSTKPKASTGAAVSGSVSVMRLRSLQSYSPVSFRLTDSGKLFTDEHVHDARAAEARSHRHDALRRG